MKFLDLFTHQHINDVIRKTFSYSDKNEILFFTDKCKINENFTLLITRSAGVEQKYILVKIPENVKTDDQQVENTIVLYPVFVIENIKKEYFGAFKYQDGIEHFLTPEQNNAGCLKIILQALAEHQALNLVNNKENPQSSGFDLKDITHRVTSLDFFNDLDIVIVKQVVENLQLAVNKLFESSNLIIRSIGCPFANNVYVNLDRNRSIFLNVPSTKIVPPAYDALMYIFALSNEKFRQEHFENLVLYYFESLNESLRKLQSKIADKITRSYYEHQVKVLLPVVKIKLVNTLLKLKNAQKPQDLLTNIFQYLQYPLINQEDIYETIKNKIRSVNYDLLTYSLVGLSEKNGHLGEYFHLKIKIKFEGEEQIIQLFAKFLITPVAWMERVLKSGPSRKEEFFYKTLLPLYSKYGLDSLLNFAPRCYLSRVDWLLILDDLSQQGYVGFKPNSVFNYDGLRAVVEQFANFHSCTIILEEILSDKSLKTVRLDDEYGELLDETFLIYEEGHPLKEGHDYTFEIIYYIVEKFPEITEKLNLTPEEVKTRLKKIYFLLFSKIKKSDTIRNVINHGDVFGANMLFKYGQENLITKAVLVDFQMLRFASPNYDLLVFLYYNSKKETRDKYLELLVEEYYQQVSKNLRRFNYDPEKIFPKETFDKNLNCMKSVGIVGAFMYAHILHIDPDFREEIAHDEEKFEYYINTHKDELVDLSWKIEHYRNILKGLVEDIVDIIKNDF